MRQQRPKRILPPSLNSFSRARRKGLIWRGSLIQSWTWCWPSWRQTRTSRRCPTTNRFHFLLDEKFLWNRIAPSKTFNGFYGHGRPQTFFQGRAKFSRGAKTYYLTKRHLKRYYFRQKSAKNILWDQLWKIGKSNFILGKQKVVNFGVKIL